MSLSFQTLGVCAKVGKNVDLYEKGDTYRSVSIFTNESFFLDVLGVEKSDGCGEDYGGHLSHFTLVLLHFIIDYNFFCRCVCVIIHFYKILT